MSEKPPEKPSDLDRQRGADERDRETADRRSRAADRRLAAKRRTFSENIDRLLGLHQLTSDWAAPLLGVSVTTLSYWRNGHREPDNVAVLKRLGDFFEIDPFALLTSPFTDLLPRIADPERFESVERRIEEGMWGDEMTSVDGWSEEEAERRAEAAGRKGVSGDRDDLGKRRATRDARRDARK